MWSTPTLPSTSIQSRTNDLLKSVARRVADGSVPRLIKLWLKAPIEERDGDEGKWSVTGGKGNARGTPPGSVASPLLANIYMTAVPKALAAYRTRRGVPRTSSPMPTGYCTAKPSRIYAKRFELGFGGPPLL
jgi:hypothetical protein